MTIPYTNGVLTAVTGVGTSDDYDTPASSGTNRWTGTTGIYVAEEILEELTDGQINEVQRTRLEIPHTVGRLVQRGDTLTYTHEGTTRTGIAGTLAHAPLVNRVKVLLEDR